MGKRVLLAVAAAGEAAAVLRGLGREMKLAAWERAEVDREIDLVLTGIGKANAAGAVARSLDARRHRVVLSVGIAGSLPGPRPAPIGAVVVATHCVFADEGVQTQGRLIECAELGFPLAGKPFEGNRARVADWVYEGLAVRAQRSGPVATVSLCSGTDGRAREVAVRTGAIAEGMEGAAVALAAVRMGVAFGEVRVVSNTTGEREKQVWDVKGALAGLSGVIGGVRALARGR